MTHEDARTIMRRIAKDYDRLATVSENPAGLPGPIAGAGLPGPAL